LKLLSLMESALNDLLSIASGSAEAIGAIGAGVGGCVVEGAGAGALALGGACTKLACASNTVAHCPHRTQPSEILSWSATTLNKVPQEVQRVMRLMEGYCSCADVSSA
jgi:hypothetical protein